MTTNEPADPSAASWREQAVARSLGSARTRAEKRVQRFLDAAVELMNDSETGKDFTVQEVVERSGQSLRTFYQYFGGKHELLLALFEESVRWTAEFVGKKVTEEEDPVERVHRFVVEYYRLCRPSRGGKAAKKATAAPVMMVDFAQQLLTSHPAEAARAFAPIVTLFGEVLDEAGAAGAIRPGLRHGPIAGIVLEAIMFNAFSATIIGTPLKRSAVDPAEELWDLILNGVSLR
ncbi:MAG: yvdT 2 [Acidimicrobiales bacterium]|nr:yvdT 2 [Acidimicrobiales bacterium]